MKTLAMGITILATIALLAMLGLHTFSALFWGSWDQDGLGSTGFWHVFQDGLKNGGWAYLIPISVIIAGSIYLKRNGDGTANKPSHHTTESEAEARPPATGER